MTDYDILEWISKCQGGVHLLTCLIGLLFLDRLNKATKLFFYYLAFLLIINYTMLEMANHQINNFALTHLMVLGEFVFLSAFYKEILQTASGVLNKYFKYYLLLIGALIIVNTLYVEAIDTFNTNAKVLVLFLILFFSTHFFYDRSKRLMEVDAEEKALRLINSALLLYYSGSFFVYLFYKFTQNNTLFYSSNVLIFNACLYLVFSMLIFIAMAQLIRDKKVNA